MIEEIPFLTASLPVLGARIVKAACYHEQRCFVGWRHSDILLQIFIPMKLRMTQECQGFVDDSGFWWDRRVSFKIAARARQIAMTLPPKVLISEMLWNNAGNPLVEKVKP